MHVNGMVVSARRLLALVAIAAAGGGAAQAVAAPSHARVTKAKKVKRKPVARAVKVDAGRGRVPSRLLASRPPLTGTAGSGATSPGAAPPPTGPTAGGPPTAITPTTLIASADDPASLQAVGVTLDDRGAYSARLSRASVTAGDVVVQLVNQGEDDHNLRVVPIDHVGAAVDFPLTGAGQNATRTLTLSAGHYRVFCTLTTPVNHENAGMNATLTVTAPGS
jgi:plastocyanin